MTTTVFAYWPVRGLGQHLRFLLEYLEVKFENKGYTSEEWQTEKELLQKTNPLANIPYLHHEGNVIYESSAIALYIINKTNRTDLFGSTLDEQVSIQQARGVVDDLRKSVLKVFFGPKEEFLQKGSDLFRAASGPFLSKLEILHKDKKFIAGNNISMADFTLYEFLDLVRYFDPTYLDHFPSLKQSHQNFSDIPQIKNYIESARFQARPFWNTSGASNWG